MPKEKEKPCWVYDLTFSEEKNPDGQVLLKSLFSKYGKKWGYQLEEGDNTGYRHFQCRISLLKAERLNGVYKKILNEGLIIHKTAISHTSTNCASGEQFWDYSTKDHTRIDGPWTSRDAPRTKQMEMFDEWGCMPYMEDLKIKAKTFDLRAIDLIYDVEGNHGKSMFAEHMEYIGLAEEVPPFRMMDHIFEWVATRPIRKCYIFDMPRGMKKDKLADFYSGIEVIKNGVAYDKRYSAKKIRFDRPRIFVFTNTLPEFSLMSKDRWKVWSLYDNQLKPYMVDDELYEFIPSDEE